MALKLIKIGPSYEQALGEMIDEWKLDQELNHTDHSPWAIFKNDYHDFPYYLDNLEIRAPSDGKVPDSVFFLHDESRDLLLGAVNIRHYLNDYLLRYGGHIGDGIRPSERHKGYGKEIIRLALKECRKLGIYRVLVTCDKDNVASRKCILANNGVLEDEVEEDGHITQRYWIDNLPLEGENIDYVKDNSHTIDRWTDSGWEWGIPLAHEEYVRALAGDCHLLLTPAKPVPRDWLPKSLKGRKVLALASGGGQQSAILSALGASVTVFDNSASQLDKDQEVATREGYALTLIKGDMSQPLPFEDGFFDLIVHPVSNVYIRKTNPLWKECYRILKPGGTLLAGLDNGINFITDENEREILNRLPFDPLSNKDQEREILLSDGGYEFSHTLEEQIGGQLKAGFVLKDLYEDTNGRGRLHELNIPTYLATKAVKTKE